MAAAAKPPKTVAWYMAVCRDGATQEDYARFLGGSNFLGIVVGIRYQAFPVGQTPPPRVAPIDLAIYANSLLDLPAPTADRNQRSPGSAEPVSSD